MRKTIEQIIFGAMYDQKMTPDMMAQQSSELTAVNVLNSVSGNRSFTALEFVECCRILGLDIEDFKEVLSDGDLRVLFG